MSGYNDFMRRAHGRNHELERRLRESSEPRLAKIYRLIHAEAIEASDIILAESLVSTLNTSIDDDYVVGIVLNNRARIANVNLHQNYCQDCKFLAHLMTLMHVVCLILFVFNTYLSFEIKSEDAQILSIISASGKYHAP